ncbi:hypothetical protein RND81_08G085200 [Saponaria officinalis]|uniref:Uncharacterized protein n=1 Tax=Saponaria officinalis TaxID=3572 RepID=A0AAW1J6B9_SAPOF
MDNPKVVGGWLTLPFIIGSIVGLSLAAGSWYANLTMFLVKEYNVSQHLAEKIYEIVNIGVNIFPIIGAILSDSYVGSFLVINVASFASLLGLMMLGLSTIIPTLRSHPCNINTINDTSCDTPSIHHYAFLLVALSLATIGFGCTRYMLSSLGAYQFNKSEHRRIFFNVYILAYEACFAIAYGVIVFIIQDQGKWSIGFGIGIATNLISIILFLSGFKYYRHIVPQHNPFVVVAHGLICVTISKIKVALTKDHRIHDDEQISNINIIGSPSKNMTINSKSWAQTLISSQNQAQDLKKIIKIMPIWSAGIILSTVITTISNLIVLQASSMDLTISRHVTLPAQSMIVFCLVATIMTLSIFDSFLFPLWQTTFGRPLKPLQRGGIGHVFVVVGTIGLAIVETGRLNLNRVNDNGPVMSAYWLIIPMVLLGIGAAYYFPGGLTFHYQEFPKSLKCSSTAMPSIQVIIGFYLSKAFLKVVKQRSSWLADEISLGRRLDIVYWILALVVAVNFGYYVACSILYKYNTQDNSDSEFTISTNNTGDNL